MIEYENHKHITLRKFTDGGGGGGGGGVMVTCRLTIFL